MSDDSMAPEVQALIEKINSLETRDSSYQRAKRLYENGDFTDSERNALGVALKAVKRRETLIEAMRIVINDKEDAAQILSGIGTVGTFQEFDSPRVMKISPAQLEIARALNR